MFNAENEIQEKDLDGDGQLTKEELIAFAVKQREDWIASHKSAAENRRRLTKKEVVKP